jgi:hypothetical protein
MRELVGSNLGQTTVYPEKNYRGFPHTLLTTGVV